MNTKRNLKPSDGSHWAKTENLLIRLHISDKQAFKEAADYAGLALSAWVRDRLCSAARQELDEASVFAPLKKEKLSQ